MYINTVCHCDTRTFYSQIQVQQKLKSFLSAFIYDSLKVQIVISPPLDGELPLGKVATL